MNLYVVTVHRGRPGAMMTHDAIAQPTILLSPRRQVKLRVTVLYW